jgi:hypothetical protein
MTLKRQFEAGASQYNRLNHLLVEAPQEQPQWLDGPFPVEDCRQPNQALGTYFPSPEISFRIQRTETPENRVGMLLGPRVFQLHAIYVSGSFVTDNEQRSYAVGRDQFVRLAERAGQCLESLPPDLINMYPPEWAEYEQYLKPQLFTRVEPSEDLTKPQIQTVERTYDAILPLGSAWSHRWCGFMHWLAWRGEDGAILKAKRQTWSGFTTLPWMPTRAEHAKSMAMMRPLADFPFETTRHFYSVLEDVFLCSALAIDMIEAKLASRHSEANRMRQPAKQTGPPASKPETKNDTAIADRDNVFISYSHKDKKYLDVLLAHLKPLQRTGCVSAWSDTQIAPSSKWFGEIKAALARTSVAVMLVSSNFLDSDFIHQHELGPLLNEAEGGGVKILWVLIRDCLYQETPLAHYQAVLPPDQPLAKMRAPERDTAWRKVCEAIKRTASQR